MTYEDAMQKFAQHICEFLDSIPDMPKNENLIFAVEVKKVGNNQYHLTNPTLKVNDDKRIITNEYSLHH